MNIKYLDWDSGFFNKKIGRIDLVTSDLGSVYEQNILKTGREENFDLVYGFLKVDNSNDKVIDSLKSYYQTTNVVYKKKPSTNIISDDDHIREADPINDIEILRELAFQAGHSSRFVKDNHLGLDSGKRLYYKWIENSLDKSIADKVLIYILNEVSGFITLKSLNKCTEIGLIAVDARCRNQNIGSKLLLAAEKFCKENKNEFISVGTQIENTNACNFYIKNNFAPESYIQIYHFWL